MEITVIIPTHRRPEMLQSALQSVANQSRRDLIKEVIVSENSDDLRSKHIVEEFPELPVTYLQQSPTVEAYYHFAILVEKVKTDYVALLGDDDMWGRYHLEEAHRCLMQEPDSIAYVGWDAYISDEFSPVSGSRFDPLGILKSCAKKKGYFKVDFLNMTLECLNITPFNMWSLVGEKDAVAFAFVTDTVDVEGDLSETTVNNGRNFEVGDSVKFNSGHGNIQFAKYLCCEPT